jgi:nitroreductase
MKVLGGIGMELEEAIRKRQSIRDYEDKPVPKRNY